MLKLLEFSKKSWMAIIAIVLLLIVQANCELGLPQYTSDIVDVGIQQGGIDSPLPVVLGQEELEQLTVFLSQEDAEQLREAYRPVSELSQSEKNSLERNYPGVTDEFLTLKELTEEEEKELETIVTPAEVTVLMLTSDTSSLTESSGEELTGGQKAKEQMAAALGVSPDMLEDPAVLMQMFAAMPKEAVLSVRDEIMQQVSGYSDSIASQAAIEYVKACYEDMGIDVGTIQIHYLLSTGGAMLLLALLSMAVAVAVGFLASRTAARTGRDLRNQVFEKVVSFSNREMDEFSTASLITRSTNDIQQIQMVTVMLLRIVIYAPIIGIGGIIKVFNTNVSMTWIIAVAVIAISCLVAVLMAVAMPKFKIMQKLVDGLNLVTREILTGLPVIRAFSREKTEEERFDRANRALMKTQLFTNRAMTIMMPAMMFIMNAITVLIIWSGAHGIDTGNLQVGEMMAFITYTMQIIMAFLMITMISIMLPRAAVAAGRVDEVLKSKTQIEDPVQARQAASQRGEVRFNHVHFRYPNAKEDALLDLDFTAKPGQTTAIIGSTGCGKSTLVNLIPRLYDVTEGSITIDGVDIRDMEQRKLRDMIGFVPQKGVLFSGTIESNIKFGDDNLSDEAMREAAEISQSLEFIDSKPDKYETAISQGGSNVSGGQKQRLSIARAIAKHPKIYVFDDSFSALDYKTDVILRRALKEKTADSTVIIVAQRISTIMHAEKILVLDEGRIVGIGTHQELLKNNEVYRQIATSQLSAKELGENENGEVK